MPIPRIGIVGTFDVENYGDLLFPLIAEAELSRRLGPVDLVPFSYRARTAPAWPYDVTSVADLPALAADLDLLLVGGGYLLRFDKDVAPGYGPPIAAIHHPTGYWLSPALVAAARDVRVVWNAPGAHGGHVPDWARPLLAAALDASTHVAVRDDASRALLQPLTGRPVAVTPDTGFGLADALAATSRRPAPDRPVDGPYVVVQAAISSQPFVRMVVEEPDAFAGLRFLALPIGPVLGDRVELVGGLPDMDSQPVWPHPLDLARLVRGAEAVVGHSYHLTITASTAGVPVFLPSDLRMEGKYAALTTLDRVRPLPARAEEVVAGFGRGSTDAALADVQARLTQHWDLVADVVRSPRRSTHAVVDRLWQRVPSLLEGAEVADGGAEAVDPAPAPAPTRAPAPAPVPATARVADRTGGAERPSRLDPDELRAELAGQRWTAHNVRLLDDVETVPGLPELFTSDTRLAAIRRLLRSRFGDDLTGLRLADLGCLEGGFAAALALDGATVVGIEAREANLAKADVLRRHLGLDRLTLERADVKEFTAQRHGHFDVVLALGIAYHLDRPAAWLHQVAATTPLLVVDTHVAPAEDAAVERLRPEIRHLSPLDAEVVGDSEYQGRWFHEFDDDIDDEARADQLWASWSNARSFWLTEESLLRALTDAGYDAVTQVHDALGPFEYQRVENSRGFYVAVDTGTARGRGLRPTAAAAVRSTADDQPLTARLTELEDLAARQERALTRVHHSLAALRRAQADVLAHAPPPQPAATTAASGADVAVGPVVPAPPGYDVAAWAWLTGMVKDFAAETRALADSRRWRMGHAIGTAFAPGIARRRDELALDRLLRLAQHADLVDPVPPPAPERRAASDEVPSEVAAAPSVEPAWELPGRARYDVIILGNVPFDSRRQRPHHIATTCARQGHRVFYLSDEGRLGDERPGPDGVVLVDVAPTHPFDRYATLPSDGLVAEWVDALTDLRDRHRIEDAVVHVHLQSWTPLAWALRETFGWKVVYDCMDEWDGFPGMGRALVEVEPDLVAGADLVVTTAERLRRKWVGVNPRTVLVRNGVEAERFVDECLPSDVAADLGHPLIGFTGGLAPWVDFALLAEVARSRPEWTFVLVGDLHVGHDELHGLDVLPNVVLTGLQPYEAMPRFLFWFDVAVIPFVVDHISEAVDPVKFYEYAASGTPIVSTRLPELDDHRELFEEAHGAAEMEAAIERALVEDPARRARRVELARANTWLHRYRDLDRATTALWPTLSVVVVTYGQVEHTRRCLDTLLGDTSHPALEVIVVDNASTDGTPSYLRAVAAADDRVRVVANATNRGFAAATNQGLALATGDVLVLLNNDTTLTPGWHVPLLRHLDDPDVGLVGPRSDNVGNHARIDVPADVADDLDAFARRLRADHAGEVFDIHMLGMFCVAMRREVYEAVGPLDEGYGIGMFEDDDYAERVRRAGWRIVCARDAFVHHVGQATFGALRETGEYDELWARNQARFEERWGRWRANDGLDVDRDDARSEG